MVMVENKIPPLAKLSSHCQNVKRTLALKHLRFPEKQDPGANECFQKLGKVSSTNIIYVE